MTTADNASLRIGTVVLTVHDLQATRRFYREVVGLHQRASDGESAQLGVGDTTLIELRRDAHARFRSPREAGLFHTAFLLPTRTDLGRWAVHADRTRVAIQGASDHAVSEAIYLADPEGNGVEIYRDRPPETWTWIGDTVTLTSEPLDLDHLMRGGGADRWTGVPDGATVGHVHLQVGGIAPAEAFYAGVLGMPLTARFRGASFFGSGGYHHHLATNIWNSRNAARRADVTTGLTDVVLMAKDLAVLDGVRRRAAASVDATWSASGLTIRDPWGTSLTLTVPKI